ncbi:MAG: FtsW/RodA/SpoVE family cell cycle protein [Actinomycetota bacterium]
MTARTESAFLAAAALVAGAGTAVVTVAAGEGVTIDAPIAVLTFLMAFGGVLAAVRVWAPRGTRFLLPPVALLAALGSVEIFRIDRDLGRLQRLWLLVAAGVAVITLGLLRTRGTVVLRRFRYLFLAGALILLLLPLLPSGLPLGGATVNGSRLWVQLEVGRRTLSFQPGEGAKVLLVVFFASYLAERRHALAALPRRLGPVALPEPRQLLPILLAFGLSSGVLVYEGDLGASILLFGVFVVMLYAATERPFYLAAGGALVAGGAWAASRAFGRVAVRVEAWLHPFEHYTGSGYQVAQGVFALGDAGLLGTGLGSGSPYLIPAAATDFVFVAIVEETGLAGGFAVLAAFGFLVTVGVGIALRAGGAFRSLLAMGLSITLALQTVLIVGGVLRLLPLTGVTLPFVSYGGSSLLANFAIVALLEQISHEERA